MTRRPAISAAAAIVAIVFASGAARAFSFGAIFGDSHEKADSFRLIHARDLARLMDEKDAPVYVYDADPLEVRVQEGVIPGARLLSDYNSYRLSELPPDRHARLVFYCHNPH